MREVFNDLMREAIGAAIGCLGLVLEALHGLRIRAFGWNQKRLRRKYGIEALTPVTTATPTPEPGARFAVTSGSASTPRRIAYRRRRLRRVKFAFLDAYARACRALRIRRRSLYVFGAFSNGQSLTSLLLEEKQAPSYLATLQAPYRIQRHRAIRALAERYGSPGVRVWVMALANPGVLYSTNPSTLSTFLDEVSVDWKGSTALARDFCEHPEHFDRALHRIARRIASRGWAARLGRIAASGSPLPLAVWAPGVEAYICWTGGYVQPFLDRIAVHLPPERYRLIPMYSMSTETIETASHFVDNEAAFLPLASGVLYEFQKPEDCSSGLESAADLRPGENYTLIVSDAYGLRRYRTGDVFLCRRIVSGLPDLQFLRREGLAWSFTGEKLTAEQVAEAIAQLREETEDFLTCVPSQPAGEAIPHYKLVRVSRCGNGWGESGQELASRFDALLSDVNLEYRAKRESRRLGPPRLVRMRPSEFARRMRASEPEAWESQFKFLPLFCRTWEQ